LQQQVFKNNSIELILPGVCRNCNNRCSKTTPCFYGCFASDSCAKVKLLMNKCLAARHQSQILVGLAHCLQAVRLHLHGSPHAIQRLWRGHRFLRDVDGKQDVLA